MSSPIRKAWEFLIGLGIPLDMLLSIVVIFVWFVVAAIVTRDSPNTLIGLLPLLLPLALIWFRDVVSEFTGSVGFHQVSGGAPPGLVSFFGWLGLAGLIWLQANEMFK